MNQLVEECRRAEVLRLSATVSEPDDSAKQTPGTRKHRISGPPGSSAGVVEEALSWVRCVCT